MKITINIPDKSLPALEQLVAETGATDLNTLFFRAVSMYLYLHRLLHTGMRLAILNRELEIEGRLIDLRFFTKLFRKDDGDSAPPQN